MTTDRNSDEADALDVILAASKPTPPASIPAAEVQALEERLRGLATQSVPPRSEQDEGFRKATIYCADELAKLIPRNP